MDFSEKWGVNVEEAVRLALIDLNTTEDNVKITVLEEPTKGFLGIGAKLAKVRVERIKIEVKDEEKPELKPEAIETEATKAIKQVETKKEQEIQSPGGDKKVKKNNGRLRDEGTRRRDKEIRVRFADRPEGLVEIYETPALEFLRTLTAKMNLELSIKAFANEDSLYLDILGKDSGTIIGKRGQTLDSIQYLTSLVVNKGNEKYIKVIVDAENYRAKREKTLEQLANRLADKVKRSGRSIRLEPMNPYERKVIHATLQKHGGVVTRSEGEEPYRRVIIEPK
ncbi:MAG: RNA-binding cell elongation regulator Jag/EloR [Anaerovoracaceae bacterium]|jgi:spoIIIJ-associated protein